MRLANNAKISHQDTSNEGQRKNPSPFIRNTASVLTIPRLNPTIQSKFNAGSHAVNLAGLALNLLRKGLIDENAEGELSQMIQQGIQKWVLEHAGDLEIFDFCLGVMPELSFLDEVMYDDDYSEFQKNVEKEFGANPMYLCIEPGSLASMSIGKTLQDIEAKVEGLGKTAYYWLSVCGARVFDVYTPFQGTYYAEHAWWYGSDNQEDFVEEISMYYEDDEEGLQNAMESSPEAWSAAFPKWVVDIEHPLSEEDLSIIANASEDSLESQVAKVVLEVIKHQDAQLPDIRMTEMDPVYKSLYLHWEDNDMSQRLVDDYLQQLNESGGEGYLETLGIAPIPSNPFKFKNWMAEMEKGWIQLKNIEQLIKLIGTRCN